MEVHVSAWITVVHFAALTCIAPIMFSKFLVVIHYEGFKGNDNGNGPIDLRLVLLDCSAGPAWFTACIFANSPDRVVHVLGSAGQMFRSDLATIALGFGGISCAY